MFSCRAACQRFGPLARRAATRLPQDAVQHRWMSSVPGGSGENILYVVLCGGALVGAVSYGYSTVTSDHARFNERIEQIRARSKTEWAPKPWPPQSKDEDEGKDEETEAAEGQTVMEEAAQVVVEAAQEVEAVAQEVEAAAQEVAKVAEAVEEAAQAVEEPPAVAVEEPESDVLLAAASSVEGMKTAEVQDELAPTFQDLKEDTTPAPKEAKPVKDVLPPIVVIEPVTEKTVSPVASVIQTHVPLVEEGLVPLEDVSAVEDSCSRDPVAEEITATEEETVVEETPAPLEVVSSVETPATVEVPIVEETPATDEVPVVEETPATVEVPVVEETPAIVEVSVVKETPATVEESVVEETPATVELPVVEETPATVEVSVVEETPATVEVPVVEETPAPLEVVSAVEETPATVEVSVVEETPATDEVPAVEETTAPVEVTSFVALEEVTEKFVPPIEETTAPLLEEVLPEKDTDTATVETPTEDANKEYIVVVLEGIPKEEKRPKVLGVGPLTGRIIPATGDDSTPPSEGGRHRLRMQMQ